MPETTSVSPALIRERQRTIELAEKLAYLRVDVETAAVAAAKGMKPATDPVALKAQLEATEAELDQSRRLVEILYREEGQERVAALEAANERLLKVEVPAAERAMREAKARYERAQTDANTALAAYQAAEAHFNRISVADHNLTIKNVRQAYGI